MRRISVLVTIVAATCVSAFADDGWKSTVNCTVASPATPNTPQLSVITSTRQGNAGSVQVRVRTDANYLKDKEKLSGVSLAVAGAGTFGPLVAVGASNGKTNSVTITVPAKLKILPAFSQGSSLSVVLPTPGGERKIEVSLLGYGAAAKQLGAACPQQ